MVLLAFSTLHVTPAIGCKQTVIKVTY